MHRTVWSGLKRHLLRAALEAFRVNFLDPNLFDLSPEKNFEFFVSIRFKPLPGSSSARALRSQGCLTFLQWKVHSVKQFSEQQLPAGGVGVIIGA
jgi:hypothetical protein